MLWSLATPLILIAGGLGIVEDAHEAITTTATYLDGVAEVSSAMSDPIVNDAKRLAVEVGLSLPILWGTGDVGAVAVRRFARQLAENAGLPSVVGTLPEAARTQSVLLAGPRAGGTNLDDIFRDRVDEPEPAAKLRLILLRDHDEHPETAALATAATEVAAERGVPVNVISAHTGHSLTRLAMLIGVTDFASVYAGLALGIDPMSAANELDGRVR
jgi:glucose/mannose-6-phosphate isomerase